MLLNFGIQLNTLTRSRLKDFALYIAIGVIVVAVLLLAGGKWNHGAFIKWGGLALNTSGLFGLFILRSKPFLRKQAFWAFTVVCLALHLVGFAVLLVNVEEWRLTWFMVMALEYPVLLMIRDRRISLDSKDS